MYYVYVLQSVKDRNLYVGFTNNLKNRLEQHNAGFVESTKNRGPLKIIYYEVSHHKMMQLKERNI